MANSRARRFVGQVEKIGNRETIDLMLIKPKPRDLSRDSDQQDHFLDTQKLDRR